MAELSVTSPTKRLLLESSDPCGDLATFIPHVAGVTISGLASAGVLFGFASFLIATGLFHGLPLPVQSMKAISAAILTGGIRPGEVAAAGKMIVVLLLGLGAIGLIGRLSRVIPQLVSAHLNVGLGLLMGSRRNKPSINFLLSVTSRRIALLLRRRRLPKCKVACAPGICRRISKPAPCSMGINWRATNICGATRTHRLQCSITTTNSRQDCYRDQ